MNSPPLFDKRPSLPLILFGLAALMGIFLALLFLGACPQVLNDSPARFLLFFFVSAVVLASLTLLLYVLVRLRLSASLRSLARYLGRLDPFTGEAGIPPELAGGNRELGDIVVTINAMVARITERKMADRMLRESEERFRSLFEQAADALFVHDLEGRFIDVNRQACEMLGYTREELLAINVFEIEP